MNDEPHLKDLKDAPIKVGWRCLSVPLCHQRWTCNCAFADMDEPRARCNFIVAKRYLCPEPNWICPGSAAVINTQHWQCIHHIWYGQHFHMGSSFALWNLCRRRNCHHFCCRAVSASYEGVGRSRAGRYVQQRRCISGCHDRRRPWRQSLHYQHGFESRNLVFEL